MRRWRLTYELTDHFSAPVTKHFYTLRCFPQERSYQKVFSCKYEVIPCSGEDRSRDSFGNPLLIGCCCDPHEKFEVEVEAVVMTEEGTEPEERTWWQLGMYRYETPYTKPGEKLEQFARNLSREDGAPWERTRNLTREDGSSWERTRYLMDRLYHGFQYVSGSTTFDTTAEEAFAQGRGVCQDYAHILLALCRREGITARYAAGAIPGEGESHAWVEVWQDGCWKGFDPTHNREADETYICFALGRDAHDCCLNQGIYLGTGGQRQEVHVIMEEF